MRYLIILMIASCIHSCKPSDTSIISGAETLIDGSLYVVHSISLNGEEINTSSNIFIVPGKDDTVWLFGTGYGDGSCTDCNDYTYYKGPGFATQTDAIQDAQKTDSIIKSHIQKDSELVKLMFIAPHFHADHLNAEFISAMHDSLGYPVPDYPNILIHTNDYKGATCNSPCCDSEPCPDKKNQYYAAPYQPSWTEEQLSHCVAIGHEDDDCNATIFKFESPTSGTWEVVKGESRKNGGHTDGTINLISNKEQIRINGTLNKPQCKLPKQWQELYVHGNTVLNN